MEQIYMTRVQKGKIKKLKGERAKKIVRRKTATLTVAASLTVNTIPAFATTNESSTASNNFERTLPVYMQWGENPWTWAEYSSSFMATDGCGPTSMAMVVKGLRGDYEALDIESVHSIQGEFDPYDAAIFSRNNGGEDPIAGSKQYELFPKLAAATGLTYVNTMDKNEAYEALKRGGAVIVNERWINDSGSISGHFFVLSNVLEDGRVVVNDPYAYNEMEKATYRHENPMTMDEIDAYIDLGTGYYIFENPKLPEILAKEEENKVEIAEEEAKNAQMAEEQKVVSEEKIEKIEETTDASSESAEEVEEKPIVIGNIMFGENFSTKEIIEEVPEKEIVIEKTIGSLTFETVDVSAKPIAAYEEIDKDRLLSIYQDKYKETSKLSDADIDIILTTLDVYSRIENVNPNMAFKLMLARTNGFADNQGVSFNNMGNLVNKKGGIIMYKNTTEGVKSFVQYLKKLVSENKITLKADNDDALKTVKSAGKITTAKELAKILGLKKDVVEDIIRG